jgi:hypothetical protein
MTIFNQGARTGTAAFSMLSAVTAAPPELGRGTASAHRAMHIDQSFTAQFVADQV